MVAMGTLAVPVTSVPRTCRHLAPLERELAAAGVPVGAGRPCPHDPDWGVWFEVDALFDVRRLKRRLSLAPCVRYEEYEGVLCGSDATFYCAKCKRAIVGLHPRVATPATLRIA
jgi:hypothetical protein